MPEKMTVNEKVENLRKQMQKNGLSAWIINGTDPHQSEYVSERWRSRCWISGFTGSAGTVVVTMDKALIWVDSRYFLQCEEQIKGTIFEMRKLNGPEASSPSEYLQSTFKNGEKVGIADDTLMLSSKESYQTKGIAIQPVNDLLDLIWTDRPPVSNLPVTKMDDSLCGQTHAEKIAKIREMGHQNHEDYQLISSLDDIAWILNLRGQDIEDTPVFLAHLLIGPDTVKLFTPKERFVDYTPDCYTVLPYDAITEELSKLSNVTIRLNPERINMRLINAIGESVKLSKGREYSTDLKAAKNPTELQGIREAHIADGVAMVNFLAKVKSGDYSYTEVSIADALAKERQRGDTYLGPSFSTIAGYAAHGAMNHYSATAETDIPIQGNSLLVLDSGGQYIAGTTDITRTLSFGKPTREQKIDYTLVLKGHLALSAQIFPKGTTGHQLDAIAHQFMWQEGKTFFHGTGHGVGFRLSVHEGPQRISSSQGSGAPVPLQIGMVISNEPGIYKDGHYGIRIENLIAVKSALTTEFGQFYGFEVLTCCPYERSLIVKSMLTKTELKQLNAYHQWVRDTLLPKVDPSAVDYLISATAPL